MQNQSNLYKYVIYPGNNHVVIQQALSVRNVWQQIPTQKLISGHLIWKNLNFHQTVYLDFDQVLKYEKSQVLLNHFEHNYLVTTKSGLVRSLKYYYSHQLYSQNYHVFETIPTTFMYTCFYTSLQAHKETPECKDFYNRFQQISQCNLGKQKIPQKHCKHNVWFVKPQSENQGRGIFLTNNLKQILNFINSKPINTTWIVQKAIERPLLYYNRKFDIRVWVLVTPQFDIYFYKIPYMRTSSKLYDPLNFTQQIHLTNNYQQKTKEDYSKYQKGNTLPLSYLKSYLQTLEQHKNQAQYIIDQILQRMKDLSLDVFLSVRKFFLRNLRKKQFQLFGLDFLIDEDFRTWLLEVNNNPYLGTPNQFIKKLVPQMINQMFEIVLDPHFPPKNYTPVSEKNFQLLHRQPPVFRINNIRGLSSQNRKKSTYPTRNQSQIHKKIRRNSQAITSMQNSLIVCKNKYSTPCQSIKNLLDSYCFNDFEPFFIPVSMLLTSNKLKQDYNQSNDKNLKLVTQTRLSAILLEPKFIQICKNIILSDQYNQMIKSQIINGYYNSIKGYKSRIIIIKNIVPSISNFLIKSSESLIHLKDEMVANIIKLLIKIGGTIDRKIFIPGQTRDSENIRGIYIRSNCLGILMFLKEKYPDTCFQQIKQFFQNFNNKDWQLFDSVKRREKSNSQINITIKLQVNLDAIQEKQKSTSTVRQFGDVKPHRLHRPSLGFPKIKR